MRAPDVIASCVAFLCVRGEDDAIRFGGTAFYVGVKAERADHGWGYLVTARHNITAAEQYPALLGRFNLTGGGTEYFQLPNSWMFPDDDSSDVAILRLDPRNDVDLLPIGERLFITPEHLASYDVGIGDEVIVMGLFSQHAGQNRNVAILRSGVISAMPGEPLEDRRIGSSYHGYLVEMRSFGGLSGSPVFVRLDKRRVGDAPSYYLLGIMRGHWDYSGPVQFPDDERDALNMGIAIVTPWADAMKVLFSEEERCWRCASDRRL